MRTALAFLPPKPSSYTVHTDRADTSRGKLVYTDGRIRDLAPYRRALEASEVFWVEPRKGSRVPLVWIRPAVTAKGLVPDAPAILLHCHGNATDIGVMMAHYMDLAETLGVEVVGMEYSGYGASNGQLHFQHVPSDAEAAFDLVAERCDDPRRIVVYGQSVGSAAAVHIAASREVGGLVLHSPLASGLQVVDRSPDDCCRPSCMICCFDIFRNDWKISRVQSPVLIMHGRQDDVVPFHNAERLHQRCRDSSQAAAYWVNGAGHNDVVEADPVGYFERLSIFLAQALNLQVPSGPSLGVAMGETHAELGTPISPGIDLQVPPQNVMIGGHREGDAGSPGMVPCGLSEPTPAAGPTDGRYERLRHCFGGVAAAAANPLR
eukprot:CAMPEP_0172676380 /NCGR_PEP_ID=MMETSP1074-20121228/13937_1 /TAXON_ID=2916 /ORGANISM="Ceratium fusus, Strain PA161109" /LENGTH=376 /DNA_ID=CAMNT_0013494037 /DNA_START=126 /DNA_END=1256 /DNA_ORIENTATION=-